MPVFIGSQRLDVSQPIARIVQIHAEITERAKVLTSQPLQIFGPKGFLYIHQRELAATTPSDSSISVFGSEDATTCHMIVLRHTGSGAICFAHCDGSDTENEVASIIKAVKSLHNTAEGRLELHIVGGFNDERQLSKNLSHQLLRAFDNQAEEIHLVTFCVTELNDTMDNGIHLPIIYGLVNVKTGEIFKAKFQDHQPDEDLRLAYTLTGGHMVNIYDAKTEQLNIGPYSWTPLPNIDFWLEQEDQQILQIPDLNTRTLACRIPHYQYLSDLACNKPSTFVPQIHSFSTSPEAEPSHFVKEVRSALQFLKKHPYPSISLFPAGKPRSYKKKDDGEWQRM
ncbi:protein N-terminal asparagine amidohydrolase isoform X2 [Pyxicephalus adspersus]|uniref:protein N-terminal asparagine amidohydrolase isoform X2 n=1 Tax=Pyxicephalus adspersus TaxID=30357 RepID=UPI003B5C21BA